MDGNGRWAQQRGLPRIAGHEAGSKSIERCVQACLDTGVQYLTLYAFSSENWKRPALEVNALMLLLENFLNQKAVSGNRIRELPICLAIPARNIGKPMRDIFNLNVKGRGVKQVQSSP